MATALATQVQAEKIAVIYPEVRDPYRQVFLTINDGLERELGHSLKTFVVQESQDADDVSQWLKQHDIQAVVALGSRGIASLHPELALPTVVGAVIIKPGSQQYTGITLNPAPGKLFQGVRKIAPKLERVHVVYDPKHNNWIVSHAQQQLQDMGMELVSYPAKDLRTAAKLYREIQQTMNHRTDALWLPLGGPASNTALLQSILETAWKEHQMVVSSNLADVRRGALFATYPDNLAMGEELGRLIIAELASSSSEPQVLFVSQLHQALNSRTAEHLGLRLNRDQLTEFEFVYPAR